MKDTWVPVSELVEHIQKALDNGWVWYKNSRCKYVSVRIDTRDGHSILCDRDGKVITLEEFDKQ